MSGSLVLLSNTFPVKILCAKTAVVEKNKTSKKAKEIKILFLVIMVLF